MTCSTVIRSRFSGTTASACRYAKRVERGRFIWPALADGTPRERVVIPAATACPYRGGRLSKLSETITETLEGRAAAGEVNKTVREKFTSRVCEKIIQPPAPFDVIPRGHVGPSLLPMILYAKCGEPQPLNRQSSKSMPARASISTSRPWPIMSAPPRLC